MRVILPHPPPQKNKMYYNNGKINKTQFLGLVMDLCHLFISKILISIISLINMSFSTTSICYFRYSSTWSSSFWIKAFTFSFHFGFRCAYACSRGRAVWEINNLSAWVRSWCVVLINRFLLLFILRPAFSWFYLEFSDTCILIKQNFST